MGVNTVVGNASDGDVDTNVDNRLNVVDVNVGKIVDEREDKHTKGKRESEKDRKVKRVEVQRNREKENDRLDVDFMLIFVSMK